MKILVIIKQTFDTEAKINIENEMIADKDVKKILNPYDEYAVEEAVQLKEANGGEVIAVGIGDPDFEGTLRHVLAMGCDDAIIIDDPAMLSADPSERAKALANTIKKQDYDLIICGYTMIDCGDGEVNNRLAQLLGLGQVMTVNNLNLESETVIAKCDFDTDSLVVEGKLPLMIGVDKGINEPRYPGMKSIMQGRKKSKKAKRVSLSDLGLETKDMQIKVKDVEFTLPEKRNQGKILHDDSVDNMVSELVSLLHTEAKVV